MSRVIECEAIKKFGNTYIKYKETEWLFPCPKCKKHNDDNLHVNTMLGVYHCFHCDFKGKLYTKKSLSDVIDGNSNEIHKNNDNNYDEYLIPFIKQDLVTEQKEALYKRGLTDGDINYYNITGGKRIQIPNYVLGQLTDIICAWEWRKDKVTKYHPKYLYPSSIKKNNILFNLHNIKKDSEIVLCEGVFNAITAGRNAIASYGCHLSDRQLELILSKRPSKLIIAYDSDLPGVIGAIDVINKLKNISYKGNVMYVQLPKGKDINDLGKIEYKKYYDKNKIKIDLNNHLALKLPMLIYDNK